MSQREIFKPFSVMVSGITNNTAKEIVLSGTCTFGTDTAAIVGANYVTAQIINNPGDNAQAEAVPKTFTLAPSALVRGSETGFPHGYTNAGGAGSATGSIAAWNASSCMVDGTPSGAVGGVIVGDGGIATLSLPDGQACTSVIIRNDTGSDQTVWAMTFGVVKFSNPIRDGNMNPGM